MGLLTIYYEYNVKCDDNSNEDFLHFSSPSRRGHASARKILVALGTEKQARKMIKDTELAGKIPAPLSLGSLDAACAGFFWISHRLNCVPLPTLFSPFSFPFFLFWRMSREWLAVSPFADTIPRNDFLQRRSQARGREIVNAIVTPPVQWGESIPSCSTLVHPPIRNLDLSTFRHRVSRFAICPRRLLFLPAAIWTRFTSGQCPIRSFLDDEDEDCGRRCAVSLLSHRFEFDTSTFASSRGVTEREGEGYGKSATEMVSCARADRWGVKPPIKRPLVSARRTGDISISSIAFKLLVTSRVFREQRGTD